MTQYVIQPQVIVNEMGENELRRICSTAGGVINMDKVRMMIKYAETCINSYLEGRYYTPIRYGDSPKLIEFIAKELTIIYLYESAYSKDKIPEAIIARKKEAIALLKAIQAGNIILGHSEWNPPFIIMRKNEY